MVASAAAGHRQAAAGHRERILNGNSNGSC